MGFALARLSVTLAMKEIVLPLANDDNWGFASEETADGTTPGGDAEKQQGPRSEVRRLGSRRTEVQRYHVGCIMLHPPMSITILGTLYSSLHASLNLVVSLALPIRLDGRLR